jgi:hypothetical protein
MRVDEIADELAGMVADLEPGCYSGADAARLACSFERVERLSATAKTLLARRAAECGEWSRAGARSAAAWLSGLWGVPQGAAQAALSVAETAAKDPELDQAMRAGELSAAQASEVAAAAESDPSSTKTMISNAKTRGFKGLQDERRRVQNNARCAEDDVERAERQRRSRYLRAWADSEGCGRLDARLAPADFARFKALFSPFEREAFQAARAEGRRESFDAYRADALLAMAEASCLPTDDDPRAASPNAPCAAEELFGGIDGPLGSPRPPSPNQPSPNPPVADPPVDDAPVADQPGASPRPPGRRVPVEVVVVVDYQALIRGHTEGGEVCYVEGVGPVPVAVARELMTDAFIAAVLKDGVDIRRVVHLGRRPTRMQMTALRVRDPRCVVPGCETAEGLEVDHIPEWEQTHHTTLDELARECAFHHDQRTYRGATLAGGPGQWRWTPPPPGPFDDPPGPFDDPPGPFDDPPGPGPGLLGDEPNPDFFDDRAASKDLHGPHSADDTSS